VEPDQTQTEIDVQMHNNTIKTLRDMRAICMSRIQIFETGTLAQLEELLETDEADDDTVNQLHAKDERTQQHLAGLWSHLTNDWERMMRLRLIWLLVNSNRTRHREVDALVEDLDSMGIADDGQSNATEDELENAVSSALVEVEMEEMLDRMKL
jgi:hypothetical protein